jgi:phosphatidylserine/phosphatidylglycerophosphate/cardiolipin synthase-like enzyme
VAAIASTQRSILFQAYSFTSKAIAEALINAKARGIEVRALLDKSQKTERYSGLTFLINSGIETRIDYKVAIAHNKVIIIDGTTVITGSFNFTNAAQTKNAENVLILRGDARLVNSYAENFSRRWALSVQP